MGGIFIFIMCVTGALLSFQPNILAFAEREMRSVEKPGGSASPLSLNEIISRAREAKNGAKPSAVSWQNAENTSFTVAFGREGQVYVNPYNGEILGEGAKGWRATLRTIEDAHRWLALSGSGREVGKGLNDAANLLFLFLAISGVYIWFPRRFTRRHFAPILWFRRTESAHARNFNWHNVIGFWCSLALIILTATGVIISYQWAGNLLYTLTGNEVPKQQQAPPNQPNKPEDKPFELPSNLTELKSNAENHTKWKMISLRLPVTESAVFTIEEGIYRNIFARSTLTLNAENGAVKQWESYGEQNAGRRLRSWARFTHTGETGGIIGQIIGFIACIGGAFLVWTGFVLAFRRFQKWRSKKISRSGNDFGTNAV